MLKLSDESYMHAAARHVVAEWLTEIQDGKKMGYDDCEFEPLSWRYNRRIYQEYSIWKNNLLWDESGLDLGDCPSCLDLHVRGIYPEAVVDVAIAHKGAIKYAIEIVHRHPLTEEKRILLNKFEIEVIEVSALWVLSQIKRPRELVVCDASYQR